MLYDTTWLVLYLDWFERVCQMTSNVAEKNNGCDAVAIETVEAVYAAHHWDDLALSL